MADAMVTARMSAQKKEAGNKVFDALGTNASKAINSFYDYVIQNKKLPFSEKRELGLHKYSKEQIAEAKAFVDSLVLPPDNRFANMTLDEIKHERLAAKGLL